MHKINNLFITSLQELKRIRSLTLLAMLLAIAVVLDSLTINIGDFLKVNFIFLPNNFAYYLFGPAVGAIFGAAGDIVGFLIKPTGSFFPGFMISGIVSGILYGVGLYKRPLKLSRLLIVNIINMIIVNLLLNTYWLQLLTGTPFMVNLPIRALKSLIMLPVETFLLFSVIKGVEASGILKNIRGYKTKTL